MLCTVKSLSEALTFAEHGENMLCTEIVLNVKNNFCTQHVLPMFWSWNFHVRIFNSMNNLLSYCWLVDAKKELLTKIYLYCQFCFKWWKKENNFGNSDLKNYWVILFILLNRFDHLECQNHTLPWLTLYFTTLRCHCWLRFAGDIVLVYKCSAFVNLTLIGMSYESKKNAHL